jgi:hypothetical protein
MPAQLVYVILLAMTVPCKRCIEKVAECLNKDATNAQAASQREGREATRSTDWTETQERDRDRDRKGVPPRQDQEREKEAASEEEEGGMGAPFGLAL